MKTVSIISAALSALALFAGSSSAFDGQLSLTYSCPGEGCFYTLGLLDYNTGSTYSCGSVVPSYCSTESSCQVS